MIITQMAQRSMFILLVWACLIGACICQRAEQFPTQDPCSNKTICSDCIRNPPCAWCSAPKLDGPRCFNPEMNRGTAGCNEEYVFNPVNQLSLDSNKDLKRGSAQGSGSAYALGSNYGPKADENADTSAKDVPIKPQKVKLQLRVNEMQKLSFQYLQAKDFPMDLYYLVDLSGSMKSHKEKLKTLGSFLSRILPNITSDFRIGFGSFVDLTSESIENLNATAYGFKNHMSLNKDTYFFDQAVAKTNVSEYLDAQKGGLDALMQAVVCKSEIGWREQARRILVFFTDTSFYQSFHNARESKPSDIVRQNDGQCHMKDNLYIQDSVRNLSTISQINQKVKEHAINVIFAVTPDQLSAYNRLAEHIEGSSATTLTEDFSNVLDLVQDQYMTIMSTVEIKDTSSDAVHITYFSSCLDSGSDRPIETNKCHRLKMRDIVEFTTEIMVKECPRDPKLWKQTFQIYPVGVSEGLAVEIEMICDCPCDRQGNNMLSGSFCECDNYSCVKSKGLLCSGPEHGECVCGKCMCRPEYSGPACACLRDHSPCRSPRNGEICSGKGKCVCGRCVCNVEANRHYSGRYCEKCPTCPVKCGEFKECVQCEVHKRGLLYISEEIESRRCGNCSLYPVIVEGKLEADSTSDEHFCKFYDDEDCLYAFTYEEKPLERTFIRAQKERECPTKPTNDEWFRSPQ